jgi:chromosomal replication initiation ATPase DnaA
VELLSEKGSGVEPSVTVSLPAVPAQALPSLEPQAGTPFTRDQFGSQPELLKIFDRYFSYATYVRETNGLVIFAPTTIHVRRIEQYRAEIESNFHLKLLRVEVMKAASAPARELPTQPKPEQLPMPLVPERQGDRPEELERRRRLDFIPELIVSPAMETTVQMLRRWSDNVNAAHPGQVLWIYGAPGSGKSHFIKQLHELVSFRKKLRMTSVISFLHEWRQSIQNNDHLSFARRYRKETDLFILENIDELLGKPGTQQEVLMTISSLLDRGAAIAVTSSSAPHEFRQHFDPALFSRLFSGVSMELPRPDRRFKELLWRSLAFQNGIEQWPIDVQVLERLFQAPLDTPRKVHSFYINAIGRLSLNKSLQLHDISELESLHAPRSDNSRSGALVPSEMVEKVARLCGVSLSAIQGNVRRSDVTLARRVVCLALSRGLGITNSAIAQYIEKDPSTVSHALHTVEKELKNERAVQQQWNWLCSELGLPPELN